MNKEQQIKEMANEIEIIGFCDGSIDFYKTASRLYRKGYRKVVFCKDCVYNKNGGCMHSEEYDERNYNPEYFCADGLRSEDNE